MCDCFVPEIKYNSETMNDQNRDGENEEHNQQTLLVMPKMRTMRS
jgi:hypothetical protein